MNCSNYFLWIRMYTIFFLICNRFSIHIRLSGFWHKEWSMIDFTFINFLFIGKNGKVAKLLYGKDFRWCSETRVNMAARPTRSIPPWKGPGLTDNRKLRRWHCPLFMMIDPVLCHKSDKMNMTDFKHLPSHLPSPVALASEPHEVFQHDKLLWLEGSNFWE